MPRTERLTCMRKLVRTSNSPRLDGRALAIGVVLILILCAVVWVASRRVVTSYHRPTALFVNQRK
jgi:hypothetical protein